MRNKFIFPLNKIQKIIPCLLVLLLMISCKQSTESKINDSIENLIKKYPQLTAGKKTAESEFKFTKSAREGKFNIEIQLFSQEQGYENRNDILVIINAKKEVFAIPLFNNKYRDYWEFPFDELLPKVPKINTTFSNEINTAIDKLIPNNDRKKSLKRSTLIDEAVNSVLNCQRLSAKDSLMISNPVLSTIDIPIENIDSTKIRLHKNYILMRLNLHLNSDNSNCYLDRENGRIYQIEYHGNKIKVKAYRMDFGMPPPIYL
ncbi:hypothetical protein C8C83_1564 [Flavobacterium sp. 90]|uniref:hypothetical protein n=1 Tax=unclassified Flavobacterium TaxID=196869 RepID=UPI000F28D7F0|nr:MULTISPECIES: hypothetical protein [unclassified Flavobacterium]RKR09903.1 hypothetical protein C8C82_1866 [Flavobacterium sp. 81]TCK53688.1 hypothetical protein C8C83_1564 [Flavobacterium sp. 90]